MEKEHLKDIFNRLKFGEDSFHELMRWRIKRVLLVLPPYDAWILEHDEMVSDQIVGQYHQLNLTTVPRLVTVPDGIEALKILAKESFDLMILGVRIGDMTPEEVSEKAKKIHPDLTSVVLFSSRSDYAILGENLWKFHQKRPSLDACFLWNGDSRLFLAIIKYVEDRKNAPNDTAGGRVGCILIVEDSVAFYSSYLPLIYEEIMTQTQRLIAEEMNNKEKYWRMRTRPKVLLARNWEEAAEVGITYKDSLIGIVSDVSFCRRGKMMERAGISLIRHLGDNGVDVPVLYQSSDDIGEEIAKREGFDFQGKLRENLHGGIRSFLLNRLGFGDFIITSLSGVELRRLRTLADCEEALETLPVEVVQHHAMKNDFSRWLSAHGEYQIARYVRPISSKDFPNAEAHRDFLLNVFREAGARHLRGRLIEFNPDAPIPTGTVTRYGSGSLGGKGRGIAFFNAVIYSLKQEEEYPVIAIPKTLIIATGEFDRFLSENELSKRYDTDLALKESFLQKPIGKELEIILRAFLESETAPLAIRSSSLLEDSQSIPLAGIYKTYMIRGGGSLDERLRELTNAIKLVWASTFSPEAIEYRRLLGAGAEEEKMAVIIQKVAGRQHGRYWFPRISGTADSINYYPVGSMKKEDGIARIAIGLGESIVEGESGYLFCPQYPAISWGNDDDIRRKSQTLLYVLDMGCDGETGSCAGEDLYKITVQEAEKLGVLKHLISTWNANEERLVDGMEEPGVRVADFRDILKYEWLPLPEIIGRLLKIAQNAMGIPVEIEYSVDWEGDLPYDSVFSLLQVRPLISLAGATGESPECPPKEKLLLYAANTLGHFVEREIKDVVWVDPDLYDPLETESYCVQVNDAMSLFADNGKSVLLIGPGRWGSRDKFLGIPVKWSGIQCAKMIVEVSRNLSDPDPSQGSHFFHNLVTMGVGYVHIAQDGESFVNWDLLRQRSEGEGEVRIAHFEEPVEVVMDGKSGRSWVRFNDIACKNI